MPVAANAAVLAAAGEPLTLETLALDPPRAGEVQVRMRASGVCHSDLRVRDGEWAAPLPLVLGHEGAGVVEAVGDGVREVAVGDHVVLSWLAPCRRCRHCAAGRAWECTGTTALDSVLFDGTTRLRRDDGAAVFPYLAVGSFADRAVVPESGAVPVPAEVPFEVAALIGCAVATGVGAVLNTAAVPAGASVAVLGCGGVGLSVVMGARLAGADPVVAVDVEDAKLDLARDVGATHAVRAEGDVAAAVHAAAGGAPDFAFEAIGRADMAALAVGLVGMGGTAVLVGMPPEGERAALDVLDLTAAGKRLLGCNYGSTVAAVDFPRLARLYLAGRLPLDRLVSDRIELGAVEDAFAAMRARRRARSVVIHG